MTCKNKKDLTFLWSLFFSSSPYWRKLQFWCDGNLLNYQ